LWRGGLAQHWSGAWGGGIATLNGFRSCQAWLSSTLQLVPELQPPTSAHHQSAHQLLLICQLFSLRLQAQDGLISVSNGRPAAANFRPAQGHVATTLSSTYNSRRDLQQTHPLSLVLLGFLVALNAAPILSSHYYPPWRASFVLVGGMQFA
jgi:hypothetical protein